jgi:RNA polymerase sigma-70 factor (ECF subfamily)
MDRIADACNALANVDPDTRLMERVQAGEPGAFETLVKRYKHRLLGFLYHRVDSRDDAEEIAQEVFLRVYRTRDRYRARSRLSTWLFAIAKNLACNAQRAQLRRPVVTLYDRDCERSEPCRTEHIFRARTDPPGRRLEQEEIAAIVRRALDRLEPRQRLVILLNNFEGQGYGEIARSMSLTPQAVKSLLWRARLNLREALQDYVHMDSDCPFELTARG